ncbi:penicillin-insensitive murein endopeptidase [uncultured Roseibium sp.]|uniref:penicillin-insensitive murein endopeptidase n=1 Tax=uncultured Roseibium sp. TaxID=1936171 RepID=UPI003216A005
MTIFRSPNIRLCAAISARLRRASASAGFGLLYLAAFAGTPAGAVSSPPPPAPKPEANALLQMVAVPVPRPKAALSGEGNATPYDRSGKLVLRGDQPAKFYFGAMKGPAHLKARSIGSYARGCLAGGKALPVDGATWQVMRLSRNRNWGHPDLIEFMEDLANDAPGLGWRGLLVGDIAQPRGGPMTSGHASHQIGLDADIWLTEMPDHRLSRQEREDISAVSMLKGPLDVKGADRTVDPKKWTDTRARLIKRAASDKRVARIFVNPAIKKALCDFEKGKGKDRSWLRTVRPWWGHHYHFHVRMNCPADSRGCKDQNPPPPGDGCGKELTWWLSDEPWVPKKPKDPNKKVVKKRPLALAALPNACEDVLTAD